jgi:recombination protein RecR
MSALPETINNAIETLACLPGIGSRSAERLIFSLLKNETNLAEKIAKSLEDLKQVQKCSRCFNFAENFKLTTKDQNNLKFRENLQILCNICKNTDKNKQIICIVESPIDIIALEKTHEFKGVYHVIHQVISPIQKIKPQDTKIPELFDRIKNNPEIKELILALPGNIEADATAQYIINHVRELNFKGEITQLSRGIPTGGDLDYLDPKTLSYAINDRKKF